MFKKMFLLSVLVASVALKASDNSCASCSYPDPSPRNSPERGNTPEPRAATPVVTSNDSK